MNKIILTASLILVSTFSFGNENSSQKKDADLQLFPKVLEKVRQSYVDVPSDNQLQENSIKGLLDNLDPHSTYLDKEYTQFKDKIRAMPVA